MNAENSVLVIGSTGLVGQAITHHLVNEGAFSQIYTASRNGSSESPSQNVIIDVRSEDDLSAFFDHHKPALVINASGINGYRVCEDNPRLAFDVNVNGVRNLLKCLNYETVTLIQLSTNAVFGCGEGNYREEDIPHPASVYGQSRWEAEKLVTGSGVNHLIIRTCDVYGFYAYKVGSPRLIHQVIQTLRSGHPFNAFSDVWSSPTSILDICRGTIQLFREGARGLYHVAGPDRVSRLDYVRAISRVFSLDDSLVVAEHNDGRYCMHNSLNIDKLEEHQIRTLPLEVGLKEIKRRFTG